MRKELKIIIITIFKHTYIIFLLVFFILILILFVNLKERKNHNYKQKTISKFLNIKGEQILYINIQTIEKNIYTIRSRNKIFNFAKVINKTKRWSPNHPVIEKNLMYFSI